MENNWHFNQRSMKESINYLLKTGVLSDCSFVVSNSEKIPSSIFKVHTFMLMAASPVFEAMFCGGLPEDTKKPIEINDIEANVFEYLLQFIYMVDRSINSIETAGKLYIAANKYMMDHLSATCVDYITRNITGRNACGLYEFANKFEIKALTNISLNTIRNRTATVISWESFSKIEILTLSTILDQEYLGVSEEIDLFKAVQRYYFERIIATETKKEKKVDLEEGELAPTSELLTEMQEVVKKIRFQCFTAKEFAEVAGSSPLLDAENATAIYKTINSRTVELWPQGFTSNRMKRCNGNKF